MSGQAPNPVGPGGDRFRPGRRPRLHSAGGPDEQAAVIRLHARPDGRLGLWTHTGFDVLATRSIIGASAPDDIVDAEQLRGSGGCRAGTRVDPGFTFGSAWKGALPRGGGYTHVDDVADRWSNSRAAVPSSPAPGSAHGPATGLLDQGVLEGGACRRTAAGDDHPAIGVRADRRFIRDADGREVTDTSDLTRIAADEPVRVRASAAWIRIDARFGSVYQRRSGT